MTLSRAETTNSPPEARDTTKNHHRGGRGKREEWVLVIVAAKRLRRSHHATYHNHSLKKRREIFGRSVSPTFCSREQKACKVVICLALLLLLSTVVYTRMHDDRNILMRQSAR